jgi:hypothetical protein
MELVKNEAKADRPLVGFLLALVKQGGTTGRPSLQISVETPDFARAVFYGSIGG